MAAWAGAMPMFDYVQALCKSCSAASAGIAGSSVVARHAQNFLPVGPIAALQR
jgi:hypothetical protein